MRTKYYVIWPRGFANEYIEVKVTNEEDDKRLNDWWEEKNAVNSSCDMDQVTLAELRKNNSLERWYRKYEPQTASYCNLVPYSVDEFLGEKS